MPALRSPIALARSTIESASAPERSTVRATVTGTSATHSGLGACTSHTYTVKAYNNSGESVASNAVTGQGTSARAAAGS